MQSLTAASEASQSSEQVSKTGFADRVILQLLRGFILWLSDRESNCVGPFFEFRYHSVLSSSRLLKLRRCS